MKNAKFVPIGLLLLFLCGGLAWIFRPQEAPAASRKLPPTQVAQKTESAPPVPADAKPAQVDSTPPAESPITPTSATVAETAPVSPSPTMAERQAGRDARRQTLEKLMQAQLDRIQERIKNAENDVVRQGYENQWASTRQSFQAQIDQLAQPPLPPVELGQVSFTEGAIIRRPLDDGSTLTLNLAATEDGQWQLMVGIQHTHATGATSNSNTLVPATPGQPMMIDFNDYQIHLTPQVPPGAVPTANWAPPPPPASRGATASRVLPLP